MSDPIVPVPGALLGGRYRLERLIGAGGMGFVYEATDTRSGASVALKVLRPDLLAGGPFTERLKREARAVSSLKHPNIVEVYDVEVTAQHAYLAMELLAGESLGAHLRESSPLSGSDVIDIGVGMLGGLVAAHDAGLIHRDVKPDNVFLSQKDDRRIVKLLDFGLVKSVENTSALTATGTVLGTFQYMSPEQAHGEAVDGRADVYSLGAVLYYALTGNRPYQAAGMEASMFALNDAPTPPLENFGARIHPELRTAVERALSKDREGRPTAHELLAIFETLAAAERRQQSISKADSATKVRAALQRPRVEDPTTQREREEPQPFTPTRIAPQPPSTLSSPERHAEAAATETSPALTALGANGVPTADHTEPLAEPPVAPRPAAEIVALRTVPLQKPIVRSSRSAAPSPPRPRADVSKSRARSESGSSRAKRARGRRIDVRIVVLFAVASILFVLGIVVGRAFVFR